ncbi:MAG TPA: signal peptidase II [Actinomycetaceae bacterium]|nr:signal peptidase II [Actinomycetaceae bacterium]
MVRDAAPLDEKHAALEAKAEARGRLRDPRLVAILFAIAVLIVTVDQLTKQWAINSLSESEARPFIGDLITFQLTFNPGAAFGLASGTTWIFTVIAVIVAIIVIRVASRIRSVPWAVFLGLVLGGAIGNLIDRLFRDPGFPEGHVVDFINYANHFIGNVADIAIVTASIGIALLAIIGVDVDGTRTHSNDGESPPGEVSGGRPRRGRRRADG